MKIKGIIIILFDNILILGIWSSGSSGWFIEELVIRMGGGGG